MDSRERRGLVRFGAPAAFLAAATVAVLLIRAGLSGNSNSSTIPSVTQVTTQVRTRPVTTSTTTALPRYYTVQSGDTFGSIAFLEHTSVAQLVRLNPGIDPRSLRVGQRIRVG